jgi:hypothetical protein
MATATLVEAGAHRLRYLIAGEGTTAETVVITTIGGATPDTLTDSIGPGVIKKISKVVADGYQALFASGAQTTAKARALWLGDAGGYPFGLGQDISNFQKIPIALCRVTSRAGGAGVENITVDADVAAGNPRIEVTIQGGGTAYLDIESPGTIGD